MPFHCHDLLLLLIVNAESLLCFPRVLIGNSLSELERQKTSRDETPNKQNSQTPKQEKEIS